MQNEYATAKHFTKQYSISSESLRRWAEKKRVEYLQTPGGVRLYKISSVEHALGIQTGEETHEKPKEQRGVCYARVSSTHQEQSLQRQINELKQKYPDYEIIKDIGSGVNWQRKGFLSLLDAIIDNEIRELVICHKDRLCQFGFDLIEHICKKAGTKLVVLGTHPVTHEESHQELTEDLLSVVNVFVAKNNGLLSAQKSRDRKRKAQEEAFHQNDNCEPPVKKRKTNTQNIESDEVDENNESEDLSIEGVF